jgi:hypothetical protein
MGLAGVRSPKMVVALIVAGFLIAAVALPGIHALLKPKEISISGQVFIVTKGAANVKLGAVEILLIEKQQVTGFLRSKQAAVDADIKTRENELQNASRGIETAKANAVASKRNYDAALARVPKSPEYVKIKSQEDALSHTNDIVWDKLQALRPKLEAVGIGWLSSNPIRRDYKFFDDGFVMRNLSDLQIS